MGRSVPGNSAIVDVIYRLMPASNYERTDEVDGFFEEFTR